MKTASTFRTENWARILLFSPTACMKLWCVIKRDKLGITAQSTDGRVSEGSVTKVFYVLSEIQFIACLWNQSWDKKIVIVLQPTSTKNIVTSLIFPSILSQLDLSSSISLKNSFICPSISSSMGTEKSSSSPATDCIILVRSLGILSGEVRSGQVWSGNKLV